MSTVKLRRHLRFAQLIEQGYKKHNFSVNELECWIKQDRKQLFLIFRGTELSHYADDSFKEKIQDYWDVVRDIRILPWRDGKTKLWGHAGFLRGSRAVVGELVKKEIPNKTVEICVTGHSLGGAIACAVGVFLEREGYNVKEIVGYGTPKTFLSKVKGLKASVTLYRNDQDVVTKVPFGRHLVAPTQIGDKKAKTGVSGHFITKYIESFKKGNI